MLWPALAELTVAALGQWGRSAQDRLDRIAEAHTQLMLSHGMTSGCCAECGHPWPCPTRVWATTSRDAVLAAWDPADDGLVDE